MMKRSKVTLLAVVLTLGGQTLAAGAAWAGLYVQTNLVSNIPGLAIVTDPNLRNPWGLSHSPTSPFWVSDQGANVSTLYAVNSAGNVTINPLVVSVPTTPAGPQGPTGQVFNNTGAFAVNGTAATFIFSNLNGTISAWNNTAGTTAVVSATTAGAVYTGLAIGTSAGGATLYAANGAQNRIDVFNGTFNPVTLAGGFVDPTLPAGLVPFNVENIGGQIYVTYAPAGLAAQRGAMSGQGVVAVFDLNGNFIREAVRGSALAAPWGLALAPSNFGEFGGALLVGNFSFLESEINAFDAATGVFLGTIPIGTGSATAGGLWALGFGNAGNNGTANMLFFTDGINGEADGLFGMITFVPEPSGLALLLAAGFAVIAIRRRRVTIPG